MSRAERRAYERMTRNQDPFAPPAAARAARARQARERERRPARAGGESGRTLTRRSLTWLLGGAGLAALIAFSIAWPNGAGIALLAAIGSALLWSLAVMGLLLVRRRAAARGAGAAAGAGRDRAARHSGR
jgi:hypothetical protein